MRNIVEITSNFLIVSAILRLAPQTYGVAPKAFQRAREGVRGTQRRVRDSKPRYRAPRPGLQPRHPAYRLLYTPLAKHYRRDLVLAEGPTAGAASKTLFKK